MLYIFYGQDEYSIYAALEEIKKGLGDRSLLDINTTVLDLQQLSLEKVKGASETVPFMAPNRLVIIKDLMFCFEPRPRAESQSRSNRSEKKMEEYRTIVEYLKKIPESTVIVLIDTRDDNQQIRAGNYALKELSPKARVKNYTPLKANELRHWIQKYLVERGSSASSTAIALLMEFIGSDLRVMASEIDKLLLYISGKTINEEDVKAVVGYAHEFNIFNLVDAVLEFQASTAEESIEQLLLKGTTPAHLLVMLARQLRTLVRAKEMKDSGMPDAEIQSKLGIAYSFAWNKTQKQVARHSLERIIAIYQKLLETDLAIKTGRYHEELALNMLIAELCYSG